MNNQGFSLYKNIKKKRNLNQHVEGQKTDKKSPRMQFVQKIRKINLMNKVNTVLNQQGDKVGSTTNISQELKNKKQKQNSQQFQVQMPKISLKRISSNLISVKNSARRTPNKIQLVPLTSRQKNEEIASQTKAEPFNKSLNSVQKMQEILKQHKNSTNNFPIDTTSNLSLANQANYTNIASTTFQTVGNTQDISQENTNRFRIKQQRSTKSIQVTGTHEVTNPSCTPALTDPQQIWNSLQLPIGPGNALKLFKEQLTAYEQSEILDYKQIFYIGIAAEKIKAEISNKSNFGFDDDKGFYMPIAKDQIAYRYELVEMLGMGSFAQVLRCFDHKHKQYVALKMIRNKTRFHQQAQIEIKLLEHIQQKDPEQKAHVVHAMDYLVFRKHIIIVFELLSMNLYELIRLNNYKGFPQQLIKRFAIQLLQALKFMKKETIIHCDLKPENILLAQPTRSQVIVIDFGSACFENEKLYTYIQSRFYRAPEVVLGYPSYDNQIDMWSFGCIVAELHSGRPLFPAESEVELFSMIAELKGLPPQDFINNSPKKKLFFEQNNLLKPIFNKKGQLREPGSKNLVQAVRSNDDIFINFIEKCLHYDPKQRLTPDQAMKHPWIANDQDKELGKKIEMGSLTSREGSKSAIRKRYVAKDKDSQIKTERNSITKQTHRSNRTIKL